MTDSRRIFQRPRGEGWLVLVDKPPSLGGVYSSLADSLLSNADLSFQPLCIVGDEGKHPQLMEFITDLKLLIGIEVAVERLEDAREWDSLDAGIVILAGGKAENWVRALGETQLGVLILEGFHNDLLLVSIGAAAAALGSWIVDESHDAPLPGLNWLVGSIVIPWAVDPAESEAVRSILADPTPIYAIGLAGGRMISLGPKGEIELWGSESPNIVLGSGWRK